MKLLEQIKQDKDAARKANDKVAANLLTTLYSEALMVGKNADNRETTDNEVIVIVKKFIKNINETLEYAKDPIKPKLNTEKEICKRYLPKMVAEDDIEQFVKLKIADGMDHRGMVMAAIKKKFGQAVDMKLANQIVGKLFLDE